MDIFLLDVDDNKVGKPFFLLAITMVNVPNAAVYFLNKEKLMPYNPNVSSLSN